MCAESGQANSGDGIFWGVIREEKKVLDEKKM